MRNLSSGTPHTANIPSRMRLSLTWRRHRQRFLDGGHAHHYSRRRRRRWRCSARSQTLMRKSPRSSWLRISCTIFRHSASGIMASYCPAMSKSCVETTRWPQSPPETHLRLLLQLQLIFRFAHCTVFRLHSIYTAHSSHSCLLQPFFYCIFSYTLIMFAFIFLILSEVQYHQPSDIIGR